MKIKYKGETSFLIATKGKIYDVLSVEKGWYRIMDDSGAVSYTHLTLPTILLV